MANNPSVIIVSVGVAVLVIVAIMMCTMYPKYHNRMYGSRSEGQPCLGPRHGCTGTYAIKNAHTGKWCAAEGGRLICNRDRAGHWEKFYVESWKENGVPKIAFKGGGSSVGTGKWCADEGNRIICNRNNIGSYETYTPEIVTRSNDRRNTVFSYILTGGGPGANLGLCWETGSGVVCNGHADAEPNRFEFHHLGGMDKFTNRASDPPY